MGDWERAAQTGASLASWWIVAIPSAPRTNLLQEQPAKDQPR